MYHRTFCWLFNIKYCVLYYEKLFNIWELEFALVSSTGNRELKRWYPESTKGCVGLTNSRNQGAMVLLWDLCVNLRTLMPPWSLDADLGSLLLFWEHSCCSESLVTSFSSSSCSSYQFYFLSHLFFPVFFSSHGLFQWLFILFRLVCIKKSLLLFIQMWLFLFSFLYSLLWCHWQCMILQSPLAVLKYYLHSFILDLQR